MAEDVMKARSFRISDEVTEKFRQLCGEFDNQNTALEALINAYEVQQARAILTDRQTDISDYDTHLQALQSAFLHSLELNANAEERIGQEFQRQLASKDITIEEMQQRIELMDAAVEQARKDVSDAEEKVKAAENRADNEHSARLAAENTSNDKIVIINGLNANIANLTKQLEKCQSSQEQLSAAETQIAELKAKCIEADVALKQAIIEKKEAVLDIKEENIKEIQRLYAANDELRAANDKLRAANDELRNKLLLAESTKPEPASPEKPEKSSAAEKRQKGKQTDTPE